MATYNHVTTGRYIGGDPLDITRIYPPNISFLVNIPATGTFVDANAMPIQNGSEAFFVVPGGGSAGIADPLNPTPAEIALLNVVDGPVTSGAKNALVYPVGNFTALAVNDANTGADGAVYRLPTVDALQVTLPNAVDMAPLAGIYRVRISGDWNALSSQATPLSFTHDVTTVDMGDGLPTESDEWVDLIFDTAGNKWLAVTGGSVTLQHVIPEYVNHADAPTNVRMYLLDGTGVGAVGLYRKEPITNAANFVG